MVILFWDNVQREQVLYLKGEGVCNRQVGF